jgi:hypothetical protein
MGHIVKKQMPSPKSPVIPEPARATPLEVVELRNEFGRTWTEELAYLQPFLQGYATQSERDAEIEHQHKLFHHFSKPLPAAQRRQADLQRVYAATRPSLRRRLLESVQRNWT